MDKTINKEFNEKKTGFLRRFSENDGSFDGVAVKNNDVNNIAVGSGNEQKTNKIAVNPSKAEGTFKASDIEGLGARRDDTIGGAPPSGQYIASKLKEWMDEAQIISEKYPDFNIREAVKDKRFLAMLRCGINLDTAHKALNYEGLVKYELEKALCAVYDDIRARGMRPSENGLLSSGGVNIGLGARSFSRKERADIAKRVENGEKIVL